MSYLKMFKVVYTKSFLKQYDKLSPTLKRKVKASVSKFESNPKDESLKAHKLTGRLSDFYSFSVDYKNRVVFEMDKKNKQIIFLKIGGHEIYK